MRRKHTLWNVLGLLLVLGLGVCFLEGQLSRLMTVSPTPTSVGPRQITQNTLGLHEYWRVPFALVGGNLAAAPGRVVYIDYVSNVPRVRVLDAANGNLLWEVVGKGGIAPAMVAADAERVDVEDTYSELHAYDIEDGRQLWMRRFTPHRSRSRDPDGDKLYIRQGGNGEDFLYTLDVRTGDILGTESLWTADHFLVFAHFPQFDLHILTVQSPFTLRAVDPVTQQTLWQVERSPDLILQNLDWPPVLLDDVLLIDTRGEIIAFDAQTGQIRWRTYDPDRGSETGLVTRAVMAGDSLYVLYRDARLARMDARTGQEMGYIQFAPSLSDSIPYDPYEVSLASNGQMLFVSFDDGRELIALGP